MSKNAIPAIPQSLLELAHSAEIGAESRVYYSYSDIVSLGTVEMDVAALGTLTADPTYAAPTALTGGYDLDILLTEPLKPTDSTVDIVLTFGVTFAGVAIASNTLASPAVITSVAHGLNNGDIVNISGVVGAGATILNANALVVTKITADTFSVAVNTTGAGTGGTFNKVGSAVATFTPPAGLPDTSRNFPPGLAQQLAGATTDSARKIRTVDSLTSITGGGPGARFMIVAHPDSTTFTEIGEVNAKDLMFPSPTAISIAVGYDSSRWVKKGRSAEKKMTFKAKLAHVLQGFARINGQRVTLKMETRKDGEILVDRGFWGGFRARMSGPSKGDGNAEVEVSVEGMFETFSMFV